MLFLEYFLCLAIIRLQASGMHIAFFRFSRKDLSNTVILESDFPDNFIVNNGSSLDDINAKVNLIYHKPNEIEFEVTSNSNGFVVISDNYHSGWKAKIDGDFAKIFRANYIMRAIPVSSGKHKVVMTFRPKILIAGLVVTIIGWVVLSGAILWCLIRRYLLDRNNRIVTQT